MGMMEKMMADKARFVPDEGFNLVGLDDFDDPGEQLYLIGNYETRELAQAEMAKRRADPNADKMFIYGPGDE